MISSIQREKEGEQPDHPLMTEVISLIQDIEPGYVSRIQQFGSILGVGGSVYYKGEEPMSFGFTGKHMCRIGSGLYADTLKAVFRDLRVFVAFSPTLPIVPDGYEVYPFGHSRLRLKRGKEPWYTYDPTYRQTNLNHPTLTLTTPTELETQYYQFVDGTRLDKPLPIPVIRQSLIDAEPNDEEKSLAAFDELVCFFKSFVASDTRIT